MVGQPSPLLFVDLGRAALLLAGLVGAPSSFGEPSPALAPVTVIATGFEKPTGLVVHPDAGVILTDRDAGVLYRLRPTAEGPFTSEVIYAGLDHPVGLAVEGEGHLLVAERGAGRLVRFSRINELFSAVPELMVEGLRHPSWLVLDPTGTVYVSARGLKGQYKPAPKPKGDLLLKLSPEGVLTVVADRFKKLRGLTLDSAGHLLAAAKRRKGDEKEKDKPDGTIFKIVQPDGTVASVLSRGFRHPIDLRVDALGALFFTAKRFQPGEAPEAAEAESGQRDVEVQEEEQEDQEPETPLRGVILKATFQDDGTLATLRAFASGLSAPAGLAFDHDGHLYVAERKQGRVLRFAAPAPPMLDPLPAFTNQARVTVRGQTEPRARITILGGEAPATGLTDGSGTYAIEVSLMPNSQQTLRVLATGVRGDGLTGPATTLTVTQDETPPEVSITGGPSGTIATTEATVTFTGTDNLTPSEDLQFAWRLDGGPWSAYSPRTQVSLTGLSPGPHLFEVTARDLAENEDPTPAQQGFTVNPFAVTITQPADGATIQAERVLVKGTVSSGTAEVGLSVNGVLALVAGPQWVADVPLGPGLNVLTVIATDSTGAQVTTGITVLRAPTAAPSRLQLVALPESGVAPLVVTWQILNQTGRPLVRYEFDETGEGTVGPPTASFEGVQTTYITAGLKLPVLRAIDDQGTMYTATAIVNVEDPQAVTARFQARWNSLKDRLRGGDIAGALNHFAPQVQQRFQAIFQQLGPDLPSIAGGLGDIQVVDQVGNLAEAVLIQQENGVPRLYFIYFRRDSLGRWLIEEM